MGTEGIRWSFEDEKKRGVHVRSTDGVVWLSFPSFEDLGFVRQGFSTREGGVSTGYWASMNLSFTRGDREENVRENFRRIAGAVGFETKDLVLSDQTHTTNVRLISADDRGAGFLRPKDYHDVDGLITDTPGVVLSTFYADCVPLFFADPVHRAVGLSHSGWRGSAGRMGEVTLSKMSDAFGTRPSDVVCGIGPSVCQDCYEVSPEVAERFMEMFAPCYHADILYKKENGKYQLDLWEVNRRILMEAGVKEENIHIAGLCTACNPDFLFSHRISGNKRGNLGAFIEISRNC